MKQRLLIVSVLSVLVAFVAVNFSSPATGVAGSHGMKIGLDTQAIAKAKTLTVRWHDLWRGGSPQGWSINTQVAPGLVNRTGPALLSCQGHVADFSPFTFRGGWGSRFDRTVQQTAWRLTSATIVLATPAQAKRFFDLVATWQARYCLKSGATVGNEHITSVRRTRPPAIAGQQAEFRFRFVLTNQPSRIYGGSVMYLRLGTANITLASIWEHTPVPASLANTLAKKLVARAG